VNTVYLIGPPGVGKSSVMDKLTVDGLAVQRRSPVPHIVYEGGLLWARMQGVAQVGRMRGSFYGTDALSMAIQPKAVEWVTTAPFEWLLGEGDRLATEGFFEACTKAGKLRVFALLAKPGALIERRRHRKSDQDEVWMRGRETKVANLVRDWNAVVMWTDDMTPFDVALAIIKEIHGED
jgi:predicted nucleotide kinase in modified base biosynthesis